VPLSIPAPVERRVRKKWSRRAKVIGWTVLSAYLAFVLLAIFFFRGHGWFYFVWTSGFAAGIRYLRAGRELELPTDSTDVDDSTRKIIGDYEAKILSEGRREVAAGTLSIPATTEDRGQLSIASQAGGLSEVD
jgi:hypothetical protein